MHTKIWEPLGSLKEKATATDSSTLAWKIPWTEEPGGLQSTGSHRVGHNWSDLATATAAAAAVVAQTQLHEIKLKPFESLTIIREDIVPYSSSSCVPVSYTLSSFLNSLKYLGLWQIWSGLSNIHQLLWNVQSKFRKNSKIPENGICRYSE